MPTALTGVWVDGQPQPINAEALRLLALGVFVAGDSPIGVRGGIRWTPGHPGLVTAAPAGLAVRINPFLAIIPGTETGTQAGYAVALTAQAEEALTPADPSFDRLDLIVARVVDNAGSTTYTVEPVTGTPAALPAAPTPPPNSEILAEVLVGAGATEPTTIVDRRRWLAGIELPPSSLTVEFTSDTPESTTSETWAPLAGGPQGVFVAPPEGQVLVTVAARLRLLAGGGWVAFSARIDGPLSYQRLPNSRDAVRTSEVSDLIDGGDQKANSFLVTGLTPGEEYSVTGVARVDDPSTLCSIAERRIIVQPAGR
jgi:hypothetical protein